METASVDTTTNLPVTPAYLKAGDGHQIPFRHWPHPEPRAVVQIAHGMAEHSGCYDDVARQLNQQGYAVVAHDHRCHGLSVKPEALGNVSQLQHWRGIISDMDTVNARARALYPGLPLILLGHSMGSFISLRFAELHGDRMDALLLEGSNYEAPWFCLLARRLAMLEAWRQGNDGRSPVVDALTFGGFNKQFRNPRTDFDWLSRNTAFVDRYIADPLCGFQCSNAYWRDFLAGLAELYAADNMRQIRKDLPVYLFAGSEDPVSKKARGVRTLEQKLRSAGLTDVSLRVYDDARHDLLHETHADSVRQDMLAWLATRVTAS